MAKLAVNDLAAANEVNTIPTVTNIVQPMQEQTQNDMFSVMEKAYKFAGLIAKSDIIPKHYRSNVANVFIAMQSAYRMNIDPMLVMQNSYVVDGKLGMNTAFAIALANKSGLLVGGINYKEEGIGNDLRVTGYAVLKSTNREISYTIGMKEAIAENWVKNPKYRTMPNLMLKYRAATLLIRTHIPEVINGMQTVEEHEDVAMSESRSHVSSKSAIKSKLTEFLDKSEDNKNDDVEKNQEVNSIKTVDSLGYLKDLIKTHNIPEETIEKWCIAGNVASLDELAEDKLQSCVDYIEGRLATKLDLNCK